MKILQETIRQIILNEAKFSELSSLCLYRTYNQAKDEKIYILFRPELIDELITKGRFITFDDARDVAKSSANFVGGVLLEKWGIIPGCYGAWEVTKSVAQDGYGPVLYDIAMADNPEGIFPDRSSVSNAAYNLWKFYRENRYDVDALPMDSVDFSWTDTAEDDCYWGSSGEHFDGWSEAPDISQKEFLSDPLNYVYRRKPMSTMRSLILRSEKELSRLKGSLPDFNSSFWSAMLDARFWSR